MVTSLDSKELSALVVGQKELALVLFTGSWCVDCRNFRPTWDAWASARDGPIYSIDILRGGPEWDEWAIDEIPTVAAYSDGSELDRVHGAIEEGDLDRLWKKLMKK